MHVFVLQTIPQHSSFSLYKYRNAGIKVAQRCFPDGLEFLVLWDHRDQYGLLKEMLDGMRSVIFIITAHEQTE